MRVLDGLRRARVPATPQREYHDLWVFGLRLGRISENGTVAKSRVDHAAPAR